jgi:serine phosphatase RsbU (regulator of sigma subunit)
VALDNKKIKVYLPEAKTGHLPRSGRARLARHLLNGRFRPGQRVQLDEIATVGKDFSAVVNSPNPKEILDAYNLRAAIEEIAGRAAGTALEGNVAGLLKELGNLDACVEHDINFHRSILKASQNHSLLRVWDSLALDVRMPAMIGSLSERMREVVESHQPIVNALQRGQRGQGRLAGLLLRNHVEMWSEEIRKSEADSEFYKALPADLERAKDVQRAFFPPPTLSIPSLSCETFYQPAHHIGGDYYDLFSLKGARWGVVIGDVSRKGIGAALIMASLQGSLRAEALYPHSDLSALVADVNQLLYSSSPAHFSAALFYAEYQPATRVLRYVNAGHNPPIVLRPRRGRCEIFRLNAGGAPVGISADAKFTTAKFQLQTGDVLVGYTDGISDVQNYHGEVWGVPAFEKLLRSCACAGPKEIIERTLDGAAGFSNGQPQTDDMTLLVLKVEEECHEWGQLPRAYEQSPSLCEPRLRTV